MAGQQSDVRTKGRFVWFDLNVKDRARAVKFYQQLFGWKTKEGEDPATSDYVHFTNGEQHVGGAPKLGPGEENIPPHWIAYVTVEDVAKTCDRVKALGGKVLFGPMTMEKVGTWAVISDPTGGVIAPFRGEQGEHPDDGAMPKAGEFCWHELMSSDPEKAAKFYGDVFGWTIEAMDMGPMGTYRLAKRGDKQTAGIMGLMGAPMSSWLEYVAVNDVDASTKQARELGAKVLREPMDIPNIGRFSVIQDPVGAVIALFTGKM